MSTSIVPSTPPPLIMASITTKNTDITPLGQNHWTMLIVGAVVVLQIIGCFVGNVNGEIPGN